MSKLSEVVAVAKKFETVEPQVLADAQAALTTFGPELAEEFPKIAGGIEKAQAVTSFLSKSNPALLAGFDKVLAFLTQLEAAL